MSKHKHYAKDYYYIFFAVCTHEVSSFRTQSLMHLMTALLSYILKSYSLLPTEGSRSSAAVNGQPELCSKLAQTILSTHEERMQRKSHEGTSASRPRCHWYWPCCSSSASPRAESKGWAVGQSSLKPKKEKKYYFKKKISS